jgi:hypothetical protein
MGVIASEAKQSPDLPGDCFAAKEQERRLAMTKEMFDMALTNT